MPRWRVESVDAAAGVLRATRRTRLCRFIDDVTVRVEALFPARLLHPAIYHR